MAIAEGSGESISTEGRFVRVLWNEKPVRAWVPGSIAGLEVELCDGTARITEQAALLSRRASDSLPSAWLPLAGVLFRSEGIASSFIEGITAPALDVAKRHGKRYAVHSFDHGAVERAMTLDPMVARGVLLDRGTADPVAALTAAHRRVRPRDVWPHHSLIDSAFMAAARALSVRVIVWTVNAPSDVKRLASLGVAGICTDDVRVLANH